MTEPASLIIGAADGKPIVQLGTMSNRHGLIAGATGTGKTVTLQILAEAFSRMGVPVFAADIKGDLSGLAEPGRAHPKIDERLARIPLPAYQRRPYPVLFWDLFGVNGHAVRTTVSEMGPLLLASLLDLNDTQTGVLYAAFRIADDEGLLLLDLKDLRSLLSWIGEHRKELSGEYGNIASASIAAIQRDLLVLEEQGAEHFFGEPALNIADLMMNDFGGLGVISVLDATRLMDQSPHLYAVFLLWLLAELFEELPEVGDADRPKMVFFFDEAHLLFDRAPKALLEKVEQVVRLIRSKGAGIFFVTQNPLDIPDDVLGQLGMRIQHALRAFTPKDRRTIESVAETFRPNPTVDVAAEITAVGIGEALVSVLDEDGAPTPVERVLIRPPESRIGPADAATREARIARSPMKGKYDAATDRESAYELLQQRAAAAAERAAAEAEAAEPRRKAASRRQSVGEAFIKSAARAVGSQLGRRLIRGILGSLVK